MSPTPTLPPAAAQGDEVAILSPSAGLAAEFPHVYELGLDRLRDAFDLEPVEFPTARKSTEVVVDAERERIAFR